MVFTVFVCSSSREPTDQPEATQHGHQHGHVTPPQDQHGHVTPPQDSFMHSVSGSQTTTPPPPSRPVLNMPSCTPATGAGTPVKKLRKTDHNFLWDMRRRLVKKAKNAARFARYMKNIVMYSSPRKKHAMLREGLSFYKSPPPQRAPKATEKRSRKTIRKRRKDALSAEDRSTVKMFYLREDISRPMPHKRYATKEGAGHVLQQTLKNTLTSSVDTHFSRNFAPKM